MSLQEHEKCLLSRCFALFVANYRKIISSRKKCGLFISVFKNSKWVWLGYTTITNCRQPHGTARKSRHTNISKHIPNNTTLLFKNMGIINSHLIALTITPLIDIYSQGIFTFLLATVFNWNEPERQLIDNFTLSHGKIIRVISPFLV